MKLHGLLGVAGQVLKSLKSMKIKEVYQQSGCMYKTANEASQAP